MSAKGLSRSGKILTNLIQFHDLWKQTGCIKGLCPCTFKISMQNYPPLWLLFGCSACLVSLSWLFYWWHLSFKKKKKRAPLRVISLNTMCSSINISALTKTLRGGRGTQIAPFFVTSDNTADLQPQGSKKQLGTSGRAGPGLLGGRSGWRLNSHREGQGFIWCAGCDGWKPSSSGDKRKESGWEMSLSCWNSPAESSHSVAFYLVVLSVISETLHILGKYSIAELHP